MNHDETYGEIFISPNNKMTARYTLYGVGNEDVFTEINVKQVENSDSLTEISIKVGRYNDKETVIDVKHRGYSDIYTEIQPIGHVSIPAEIYVPPHNKMWALYEVQQPPKITDILNPKQDSFTREKSQFKSINYGKNNTLAVGRTEDDYYRSYIQFSFEDWETRFVIVESKLRLHYSGVLPPNSKLELLTVNEPWAELGVTDLNRPSPIDYIVAEFTDFPDKRYVEFEMTDIVIKWLERTINNHGFMVRASNESSSSMISFRARESSKPPELLITYYDSRVFSTGRSQTLTEIFVWYANNDDTKAEIEVGSLIGNEDKLAEVYVHLAEVPIDSENLVEITVSRPLTNAEVTVSTVDESLVETEISVRSNIFDDHTDVELTVSRDWIYTEIFSKYGNTTDTEVTVQRHDENDIESEITITREFVSSEIEVRYRDDIATVIEIQRHQHNDTESEIVISKEAIPTIISVKHREDIATEITTRRSVIDNRPTQIIVNKPSLDVEIFVPYLNDTETEITVQRRENENQEAILVVSKPAIEAEVNVRAIVNEDIETEITPRAIGIEDVETSIVVTRKDILTEITVVDFVNVDAEIYVKHKYNVETEINITVHDSVDVEIDVVQQSKLPVEIAITRPDIYTVVTVPYWDDNDVDTELEVRILKVSDIDTEIIVRTKGGAYAFII